MAMSSLKQVCGQVWSWTSPLGDMAGLLTESGTSSVDQNMVSCVWRGVGVLRCEYGCIEASVLAEECGILYTTTSIHTYVREL